MKRALNQSACIPFRLLKTVSVVVGLSILIVMLCVGGSCKRHPSSAEGETNESNDPVAIPKVDSSSTAEAATERDMAYPDANQQTAGPPPAPKPTEPLAPDASCVTAECHATYKNATYIHGAMVDEEGGCSVCHASDTGDHVYPLIREGNEACQFCHAIGGTRIYQHDALVDPGCTSCHDPHISETKYLLTSPSINDLCRSCHVFDYAAYKHSPFSEGECTACHQAHESDYAGLLRGGEGSDHCYLCHEETGYAIHEARYTHEPAVEDCTNCHDPHASEYEHQLRDQVEALCLSCHEEVAERIAQSNLIHGAISEDDYCGNCHDAHASDYANLLYAREDEICLKCHNKSLVAAGGRTIPDMTPVLAESKFLHGPIRSGQCSECHDPHAAPYNMLLLEYLTDSFYVPFEVEQYTMCFECHDRQAITSEYTSVLTGFRNGEVNLHYVHVDREKKGRACRSCHQTHGSNLPRHIAVQVPFDDSAWMMDVGFEITDDGGRCASGCHEARAYGRTNPVPLPSNEYGDESANSEGSSGGSK